MLKLSYEIPEMRLEVERGARVEINGILGRKNRARMNARLDREGRPLPPGVDLEDTGALKRSLAWDEEGYSFRAPHAGIVDSRYRFAGLDERAVEEEAKEIARALEGRVAIEEE